MKKKIGLCLTIIFIIFSLSIYLIYQYKISYIELIQLSPNTRTQMMGYFIKTRNGKNIVIDGGTIGDSENLIKYIDENGGKVDYWFLTHFHSDHTGAISNIINNSNIQIDNIVCNFCNRSMVEKYEENRIYQYDYVSKALLNNKVKDKIITAHTGDIYYVDNVKIKIISTYENDITNNIGNNSSMVFKLYINEKTLLFLGDIGIETSEKLLKNNSEDLKSDYVQVAHHGQKGATYQLYEKISPKYCLWPTPEWLWNNDNGSGYNTGTYKTLETREWMKKLNVQKNYVAKDGDIKLKIK